LTCGAAGRIFPARCHGDWSDGFDGWRWLASHAAGSASDRRGTWAFIEITDEVFEGSTQRFDDWAIKSLRRATIRRHPSGRRYFEIGAI